MGQNFNSICPDSTRNNERLCFSDESCSAVDGTGRADAGQNFNSICPDSTRNNERLCFSDESCSAIHGTGRADAGLE